MPIVFPDYESTEEHVRRLTRMLQKELRGRVSGAVGFAERAQAATPDPRSRWQKFVQSTEAVPPTRILELEVPVDNRRVTLEAALAREPRVPTRHILVGLTMEVRSRLRVPGEIAFHRSRSRFEGPEPAARFNQDAPLAKLLRRFLVTASYPVKTSEASFVIEPDGEGSRIFARTLPQETWGGFVHRLGVDRFLEAVSRCELRQS